MKNNRLNNALGLIDSKFIEEALNENDLSENSSQENTQVGRKAPRVKKTKSGRPALIISAAGLAAAAAVSIYALKDFYVSPEHNEQVRNSDHVAAADQKDFSDPKTDIINITTKSGAYLKACQIKDYPNLDFSNTVVEEMPKLEEIYDISARLILGQEKYPDEKDWLMHFKQIFENYYKIALTDEEFLDELYIEGYYRVYRDSDDEYYEMCQMMEDLRLSEYPTRCIFKYTDVSEYVDFSHSGYKPISVIPITLHYKDLNGVGFMDAYDNYTYDNNVGYIVGPVSWKQNGIRYCSNNFYSANASYYPGSKDLDKEYYLDGGICKVSTAINFAENYFKRSDPFGYCADMPIKVRCVTVHSLYDEENSNVRKNYYNIWFTPTIDGIPLTRTDLASVKSSMFTDYEGYGKITMSTPWQAAEALNLFNIEYEKGEKLTKMYSFTAAADALSESLLDEQRFKVASVSLEYCNVSDENNSAASAELKPVWHFRLYSVNNPRQELAAYVRCDNLDVNITIAKWVS